MNHYIQLLFQPPQYHLRLTPEHILTLIAFFTARSATVERRMLAKMAVIYFVAAMAPSEYVISIGEDG